MAKKIGALLFYLFFSSLHASDLIPGVENLSKFECTCKLFYFEGPAPVSLFAQYRHMTTGYKGSVQISYYPHQQMAYHMTVKSYSPHGSLLWDRPMWLSNREQLKNRLNLFMEGGYIDIHIYSIISEKLEEVNPSQYQFNIPPAQQVIHEKSCPQEYNADSADILVATPVVPDSISEQSEVKNEQVQGTYESDKSTKQKKKRNRPESELFGGKRKKNNEENQFSFMLGTFKVIPSNSSTAATVGEKKEEPAAADIEPKAKKQIHEQNTGYEQYSSTFRPEYSCGLCGTKSNRKTTSQKLRVSCCRTCDKRVEKGDFCYCLKPYLPSQIENNDEWVAYTCNQCGSERYYEVRCQERFDASHNICADCGLR